MWTLLVERCKELDFSLATGSAASASSIHCVSPDTLAKWSNLKLELEAAIKYAEVISDLVTYTTVALEDITTSSFRKSLIDELEGARKKIKDLVHI